MTGLPDNEDRQYKSLLIFPSQELDWRAAIEIPEYATREDWVEDKKTRTSTKVYSGKALAILPSDKDFLKDYDNRLYQLLGQVSKLGGVTISLQDDENHFIVGSFEDSKNIYPFDAVRIRPHSTIDIHSLFHQPRSFVAGSNAQNARGLLNKTAAFTQYNQTFKTKEELIEAIKTNTPSELFLFEKSKFPFLSPKKTPIKETVPPLKIVFPPGSIERLFEG